MKTRDPVRFKTPSNRLIVAGALLLAATFWIVSRTQAQLLADDPWPGTPSDFLEIVIGWDFTGMSQEEETAFWSMMNPPTDEEIESTMTPEQILARREARFSMSDPDAYHKLHPVQPLTPDQQADADFHLWAMTHPQEAGLLAQQGKTSEQLRQEAIEEWMILHPIEALQLFGNSLTPDQLKAQVFALMEANNLQLKPKPIFKTVTFEEASAIWNSTNKPQN